MNVNAAAIAALPITVTTPHDAATHTLRSRATRAVGAAAFAAGLLAAPAVSADAFRFTSSGMFDASIPASFFTAAGGTWSIAFNFDPGLMPVLPELGQYFGVGFWSFSLTVNGVAVPNQPALIAFYNGTTNSGGVDLFFNDAFTNPNDPVEGFSFYGPQVYTGSEFLPTMVPGTYTTFLPGNDGLQVLVNSISYGQGEAQFTITAIPLPPPLLLGLAGLGMIGVVARRRPRAVSA